MSAAASRMASARREQIATRAPDEASACAAALPSPWLAAHTSAILPVKPSTASSRSRLFPVEVIVGLVQPVLTDRAEEIQLERVLEGLRLVFHPGGDVEHLPFAHGDLLAGDQEFERA